jgi:tRNA uracil 4-sulfurtransferase
VTPSPQAEQSTQAAERPRDEPCVLLKLGEIVLKGRNRQQFERILHGNIRAALRDTGIPVDMRQREGVILLRVADGESRGADGWAAAAGQITERVRDVPGIVTVAQPLRVAKTPAPRRWR